MISQPRFWWPKGFQKAPELNPKHEKAALGDHRGFPWLRRCLFLTFLHDLLMILLAFFEDSALISYFLQWKQWEITWEIVQNCLLPFKIWILGCICERESLFGFGWVPSSSQASLLRGACSSCWVACFGLEGSRQQCLLPPKLWVSFTFKCGGMREASRI